jgi:hypothetical protein
VQLRYLYKKQIKKARPLFPDPTNGAAFVPESKTSLLGSGKFLGILVVSFKMADKKGDRKKSPIPPAGV